MKHYKSLEVLPIFQYQAPRHNVKAPWHERKAPLVKTSWRQFWIDVQFSTDKKLATTQDRQTLQNSDEKQYCQYWMLRLFFLLDFPQTELACWNSIC